MRDASPPMNCARCDVQLIRFEVPVDYREYLPSHSTHAAVCPRCLTLTTVNEGDKHPEFDRISEVFPQNKTAAIPLALALGLLDSLALHRSAIQSLLHDVETAGTDPLLVIDRLQSHPDIQPIFDIDRRRHQLEQLLD